MRMCRWPGGKQVSAANRNLMSYRKISTGRIVSESYESSFESLWM